jgi:hypothetical protein
MDDGPTDDGPTGGGPSPRLGRRWLLVGAAALTVVGVGIVAVWLGAQNRHITALTEWVDADQVAQDPARGCPTPAVSQEEAVQRLLDSLRVDGVFDSDPMVVSTALMTGSAFAWAQGQEMDEAPVGCVWGRST